MIVNKASSYQLNLTKTGDLTVSFVNSLGRTFSLTALKSLKAGVWQKVGVSYSGSEFKIYINGALKIKKAQTGTIRKNTNAITLGGLNSKLAPSAFSGNLDELKIFNVALSDQEVKASYDADVKPPDTGDPSLTTFTFTYANQLVKAVKGSSTSYFNYDAASQRVSKITGTHTNLYPLGGYDYESDSDPNTAFTKTNYTISGDGQTSVKETVSTKPLQSGVFYTHTDHLGSSAITTGVEGSIRQLVDYYPFGSSHFEQSWDNYANDYKYTGKEQDEEIGLYYYGARYYDAEVGRWASRDAVATFLPGLILIEPQLFNLYAYTNNNPIIYIDPDGNFLDTAWDAAMTAYDVARLGKNAVEVAWGGIQYGYGSATGDEALKTKAAEGIKQDSSELAESAIDVTVDAVSTAIPFVPAGSTKVLRAADKALDANKAVKKVDDVADASKVVKKVDVPGQSTTKQIGPAGDSGGEVTKQIPDNWTQGTTKKGDGTKFQDPNNPTGNNVRVMPGNPNSSNPAQQQPYVKQTENGKVVDVSGQEVKSSSPEAHIPKQDFQYNKPK